MQQAGDGKVDLPPPEPFCYTPARFDAASTIGVTGSDPERFAMEGESHWLDDLEERPMRMDARWWLLGCFLVLSWIIQPPRLEAG